MKVYISGPMTGKPDYNRAAFLSAAEELTEDGCIAVHTDWMIDQLSEQEYMLIALQMLLSCDAIYLLKDWDTCPISQLEHSVARACGLALIYVEE